MRRAGLFLLALVSLGGIAKASYSLNEVLTELENTEQTISAIRFNFEQDIQFTQMNTQSSVGGEALFAKSGKLHITKKHPDQQETISDGKKVWVFNPAFNQVWEGSSKKWMESTALPKGLIPLDNYVAELRKNFVLTLAETKEKVIQINAVPKNKGLGYRLELFVSSESWLPIETVYVSDSARIVTRWSEHKVNPVLTEGAFRFVAPRGTDVIPLN